MWYTIQSKTYDPAQLQASVELVLERLGTRWIDVQTERVPRVYRDSYNLSGINLTHPRAVDPEKRVWGLNASMDWIYLHRGYAEHHYTEFLEEAEGTYLKSVAQDLVAQSPRGLGRVQLSWLPAGVETFWGRSDVTGRVRVHIPIYAPPRSRMFGPDRSLAYWPADGSVYQFSTRVDHKMVNDDVEPQLHLIAYLAD